MAVRRRAAHCHHRDRRHRLPVCDDRPLDVETTLWRGHRRGHVRRSPRCQWQRTVGRR